MSIRLRLALWYGVALAVLLILCGVAIRTAVEQQLRHDIDAALLQPADEVVGELQQQTALPGFNPSVYRPIVQTFKAPGVYVQLDDATGKPFAESPTLQQDHLPFTRSTISRSGSFDEVQLGGASVRLYTRPLRYKGQTIGYVQVGKSLVDESRALRTLTTILVLVGVSALVLSSIVAWLVAGRALRPLARMTAGARAIARSGGFGQRLSRHPGRDELATLSTSFNDVLTSLDRAHAAQQRFLTDASHELRTPLTALEANLDFLAMAPDAPPGDRDEALLAASRAVKRMGRLVDDLLYLARVETGQELHVHPVELDQVVVAAYKEAKPLADGRQTELASVEEAVVLGDPDRLQQVLLILLDNAFKYTPSGGSVLLALEARDGWATVSVVDNGIGIPEEEQPRIFNRFYRSPRTSSRQPEGSGLGLAIAQQIVEGHHGRIAVQSVPGQGSVFTVSLPLHR